MSLPALAAIADIETRLGLDLGSIDGNDYLRAQAVLDDASALVRAEARVDWVDVNNMPVPPPAVKTVVIMAAVRGYRNPDGVASENLGGAYFYQLAPDQISVYLTDGEKDIVRKAALQSTSNVVWSGTGNITTASAYWDYRTGVDSLDKYWSLPS